MTVAPPLVTLTRKPELTRDDPEAQQLTREYRQLGRYIAGVEVTPYQTEKYLDFHRRRRLSAHGEFDRVLMRLAHAGRFALLLADAYSGTLRRTSVLRVKLMLTLAILECSPPSFHVVDAPDRGRRLVFAHMALRIAAAAAALALAIVLLAPVHVWCALRARGGRT